MATSVAALGPTIISVTGLIETAIGTSWTVPAGTKSIKGIRAHIADGTVHDAVLTAVPRLRLYSEDVKGLAPCSMLLQPNGASPVTSGNSASQWKSDYYPLNVAVNGGEVIYFYGTMYVTKTTAPQMSIDIYFSTESPSGVQYHYQCAANIYANPVTAALKTSDPTTWRISGKSMKITCALGIVWQTTTTAAVGCIGKFYLESTDFKTAYGISWTNDGGGGILSAGDLAVHLDFAGHINPETGPQLDIPCNEQTNITQSFQNGPTNIAGAFVTCVQFVKARD